MTTALDNLIQTADAAAAQEPVAPANLPTVAPVGGALAKPSLDNFIDGGGMDVESYLRLNDSGFRFGDKMQGLLDEVEATINMDEVTPIHSFRYEVGGNTKFIKSYDGVTTSDLMNFQQAVATASAIPGVKTSGIYPTVEIPLTLVKDVADPKKSSDVVFKAGTRIGYTPSVTGFKAFQSLAKALRAENPELLRSIITVKAKHAIRTNSNNNRWGVIEFERMA